CFSDLDQPDEEIEIRGRDPHTGIPKILTIPTQEIWKSMSGQIDSVARQIKTVLENIPPELSADVIDRGITLTGGVAMLRNIGRYLGKELCLNVNIAAEPLSTAVLGAGRLLEEDKLLERVSIE
ncbi:MAG: rod shape-determining protein, partial [Desulfobacterales bacterium]